MKVVASGNLLQCAIEAMGKSQDREFSMNSMVNFSVVPYVAVYQRVIAP